MKKFFFIFINTLLLIFCIEIFFKIKDFFDINYFDKKKNIISFYSNYKKHPLIGYTARKNAAGKIIHYTPSTYFQTSTNSDGFRTHEFYPKHKKNFRVLMLGDSFLFGMNANDNETIGVKLENLYKEKISKNIEVLSLGVTGYSALNYAGIARTYFDYLMPDLIIICVDQSDFNDDENKIKIYDYESDENNYPYFIKFKDYQKNLKVKPSREIVFFENKKLNFINKIKLEISLFERINFFRHKLKKAQLDNEFNKLKKQNNNYIIYNELTNLEKKDLHNLIDAGDILKYDLEKSKEQYTVTLNSLKYVAKQANSINAKFYLSSYPYSWYIDPNYSKYFQLKNFGNILDFRGNTVYPDLLNHYAEILNTENLDSYPHFMNSNKKFWGDYDPHFNADGYSHYANFLFNKTKNFINKNL